MTLFPGSTDTRVSDAMVYALRRLDGQPGGATVETLFRAYEGNGYLHGRARVGRRGAAGRMYGRLVDAGLVDAATATLTVRGEEAARARS